MTGRPWYKRCGADFIAGTMGLTLEEKGAYSLCLDLIYDHDGPIPDDARWMAGICGCSVRKWKAVRERLIEVGKLYVSDGRISNVRADFELENRSKSHRKVAKSHRKVAEKCPTSNENNDLSQAKPRHRAREEETRIEEVVTSSLRSEVTQPALFVVESRKPEPPPTTASKAIYDLGKAILARADKPPGNPGAVVTRWLRDHGEDKLFAALRAAEAKGTPDPVPFVTACLRGQHGARAQPPPAGHRIEEIR